MTKFTLPRQDNSLPAPYRGQSPGGDRGLPESQYQNYQLAHSPNSSQNASQNFWETEDQSILSGFTLAESYKLANPSESLEANMEEALRRSRPLLSQGRLADYIPELAKANPDLLGLTILDTDGTCYQAGDCDKAFTIQSIAKVALLLKALQLGGFAQVFSRVGMEPSGAPFSEFTTLGDFSDKPSNPFINSGAIVLSSFLAAHMAFEDFLDFLCQLCNNPQLQLDSSVYRSERQTSERNHSLAWELKRLRLLSADLDLSLDFYTKLCSIEVRPLDLAHFGLCLARGGLDAEGKQLLLAEDVTTTLALMSTCGLYDASGEFAVEAGLPAKSGVGGGILAVAPGQYGIGAFGPALDRNGNSIGGINALKILSHTQGWHVLA